jgi:hypothetical protein
MEVLQLFFTLFGLFFLGTTQDFSLNENFSSSAETEIVSTTPTPVIAPTSGSINSLAQCLTQKGVVMYGAFWCPHCQEQKKLFGDDFQLIKYQECDAKGPNGNPQICIRQGITGYPTWQIPGQEDLVGEQSLAKLAEASNCPY